MPDPTDIDKVTQLRRQIDDLRALLSPAARAALAGSILQTIVLDPVATENEKTAAVACVGIIALVLGTVME